MKIVIQRVSEASVTIDGRIAGSIKKGFLILLGIAHNDTEREAQFLADKVANLRIFDDQQGKMNLSLKDVEGSALVISQFTLYGDAAKGRRPSFSEAAKAEKAITLYEYFITKLRKNGIETETGVFGAKMEVSLINSGPFTIVLTS